MFGKKKKVDVVPFDPETQKAVLHCSICNGEQVAGFKNKKTGEFSEVCFIRNGQDLEQFLKTYGLDHIEKEY